jgi:hypothetical protein
MTPLTPDHLKYPIEGDPISAEQYSILVDAVRREITGPNVIRNSSGIHIGERNQLDDIPVVLVVKPKRDDTWLNVRQVQYKTGKVEAGTYKWASKMFKGYPEFGFTIEQYKSFYWRPPDPDPRPSPADGQHQEDQVPDVDAIFLYARFVAGSWIVGHPPNVGMGFGVVVDIFDGMSNVLTVRQVIAKADEIGAYEFESQEVDTVRCWPGFQSRHYGAFVWPGTSIAPETQIIPIMLIDGNWYAQPLYRIPSMIIPQGLNFTDCQVIPETSP